MGLRDCTRPALVSRTVEVMVLAPPGTSSGVEGMQWGWWSLLIDIAKPKNSTLNHTQPSQRVLELHQCNLHHMHTWKKKEWMNEWDSVCNASTLNLQMITPAAAATPTTEDHTQTSFTMQAEIEKGICCVRRKTDLHTQLSTSNCSIEKTHVNQKMAGLKHRWPTFNNTAIAKARISLFQNNPKITQPSQQNDKSTQYNISHYMKTCERWRDFLYVRTFNFNLQVSTLAGNSYSKRITNTPSFTVLLLLLLMKLQYLVHEMKKIWCVRCKTLTLSSPAPFATSTKRMQIQEMARLCHRCPTFRRGEEGCCHLAHCHVSDDMANRAPPPSPWVATGA